MNSFLLVSLSALLGSVGVEEEGKLAMSPC
jgi:hypothetical protein